MLEVKEVSYKYKNGNLAIDNINLNIKEGEFVSIVRKKWFTENLH